MLRNVANVKTAVTMDKMQWKDTHTKEVKQHSCYMQGVGGTYDLQTGCSHLEYIEQF